MVALSEVPAVPVRAAYLTTRQAARVLSCDRATVAGWAARGLLPGAVRVGAGGHWRIPLAALEGLTDGRREAQAKAPAPKPGSTGVWKWLGLE